MSDSGKPTIPAGDIIRGLKIPGWLRWILNLLRGTKIQAGGVDILLDNRPGKGDLGQPHKFEPPKMGGPR